MPLWIAFNIIRSPLKIWRCYYINLETINRECNLEIVEVTAIVQMICEVIIFLWPHCCGTSGKLAIDGWILLLRGNWRTVEYENMAVVWDRFDAFGFAKWWWTKKLWSGQVRNKNWCNFAVTLISIGWKEGVWRITYSNETVYCAVL